MQRQEQPPEIGALAAYYETLRAQIAAISNPRAYIHDELIPHMDAHRNRTTGLSFGQVLEKLYSTRPEKPGEYVEYLDYYDPHNPESRRFWLTPRKALEAADVVYYQMQPAMLPYSSPMTTDEEQDAAASIEGLLIMPADIAYRFCILKYITRMSFTSRLPKPERDNAEAYIMARFLLEPEVHEPLITFRRDFELHDQARTRSRIVEERGPEAIAEDERIISAVLGDTALRARLVETRDRLAG